MGMHAHARIQKSFRGPKVKEGSHKVVTNHSVYIFVNFYSNFPYPRINMTLANTNMRNLKTLKTSSHHPGTLVHCTNHPYLDYISVL